MVQYPIYYRRVSRGLHVPMQPYRVVFLLHFIKIAFSLVRSYLNQAILMYQRTGDYDRFWSINYRLVMNDGQVPRHIPLRIYLPDNCPVIQEPISPLSEDGEFHSCGILY